eukprot:PhF_6_TR13446/c0_g2_i2/m.21490
MYGGIEATDPYPENSTMSLSIRDCMMDGGNSKRVMDVLGIRNVTLHNMTIRNGKGPLGTEEGGCIRLRNVTGYVLLLNVDFALCQSIGRGGCLHFNGNTSANEDTDDFWYEAKRSVVYMTNVTLTNCVSKINSGGGMYLANAHVIGMRNVFITKSTSGFNGGCANIGNSETIEINNLTTLQCASLGPDDFAGCVSISLVKSFSLQNSLMDTCSAANDGGCLRLNGNWESFVENITVKNCVSTEGYGGGIFVSYAGLTSFRNIVIKNASSFLNGSCFHSFTTTLIINNALMDECIGLSESTSVEMAPFYDGYAEVNNLVVRNAMSRFRSTGSYVRTFYSNVTIRNLSVLGGVIQPVGGAVGCLAVHNFQNVHLEDTVLQECHGPGFVFPGPTKNMSLANASLNVLRMYIARSTPCIEGMNRIHMTSRFENLTLRDCIPSGSAIRTIQTFTNAGMLRDANLSASPNQLLNRSTNININQDGRIGNVGMVAEAAALFCGYMSSPAAQFSSRNAVLLTPGCNQYPSSAYGDSMSDITRVEDDLTAALIGYVLITVVFGLLDCAMLCWKVFVTEGSAKSSLSDRMRQSSFPGLIMRILYCELCVIINLCTRLFHGTTEEGSITVGQTIFACFCTGASFLFCVVVGREIMRDKKDVLQYESIVGGVASWSRTMGGMWNNANGSSDLYMEKYGFLIASYKDTRQWYAICEIALTVVIGILTGIQTKDEGVCIGIYSIMLVSFVGFGIALRCTASCHTPREEIALQISLLLSSGAMVCKIVGVVTQSPSASDEKALGLLSASTCVCVVSALWSAVVIIFIPPPPPPSPQPQPQPSSHKTTDNTSPTNGIELHLVDLIEPLSTVPTPTPTMGAKTAETMPSNNPSRMSSHNFSDRRHTVAVVGTSSKGPRNLQPPIEL